MKHKASPKPQQDSTHPIDSTFAEIRALIQRTQPQAIQAVNTELIALYWQVGEYIYAHDKRVSTLLRQLPWTHNLIILSQSKRTEERELSLKMAILPRR